MFTGIVHTEAIVLSLNESDNFMEITLSVAPKFLSELQTGASIAINGVCLTVTSFDKESVSFDVIDETLKKTNLGQLVVGSKVNFERSLTFGTEIGGHIVSGHIQTTATILESVQNESNWRIALKVDPEWMKYILHKGFVAVNGCSLTVGEVRNDGFDLHLIPETMKLTNLGSYEKGDMLNIEVDQQTYTTVQTVERYLANRQI